MEFTRLHRWSKCNWWQARHGRSQKHSNYYSNFNYSFHTDAFFQSSSKFQPDGFHSFLFPPASSITLQDSPVDSEGSPRRGFYLFFIWNTIKGFRDSWQAHWNCQESSTNHVAGTWKCVRDHLAGNNDSSMNGPRRFRPTTSKIFSCKFESFFSFFFFFSAFWQVVLRHFSSRDSLSAPRRALRDSSVLH